MKKWRERDEKKWRDEEKEVKENREIKKINKNFRGEG